MRDLLMSTITCFHCFTQFRPEEVFFRCPAHSGERFVFPNQRRFWASMFRMPTRGVCPKKHKVVTRYRVCPNPQCHADLPFYVGRTAQRIVAVTGCSGTGKTVFLWSLLHQIQNVLAREPEIFVAAMFEDDASAEIYRKLYERIWVQRRVPDLSIENVEFLALGNKLPPVIVRLLSRAARSARPCNLVFYDPAGELFDALENTSYLRYLTGAAGIIFLTDPPAGTDEPGGDLWASRAADGLNAVIHQIRAELGSRVAKHKKIPKPLAVVVTKSDQKLFVDRRHDAFVAGLQRGQDLWLTWDKDSRRELDGASAELERYLRDHEFDGLVNLAKHNFEEVRFFAISSLGRSAPEGRIAGEPRPIGVENPLYWILKAIH